MPALLFLRYFGGLHFSRLIFPYIYLYHCFAHHFPLSRTFALCCHFFHKCVTLILLRVLFTLGVNVNTGHDCSG